MGLRAYTTLLQAHLNQLLLQRPDFQITSSSEELRIRTSVCELLGDTIQPITNSLYFSNK
jgi:hypothetical protein